MEVRNKILRSRETSKSGLFFGIILAKNEGHIRSFEVGRLRKADFFFKKVWQKQVTLFKV
ncbi:MAG: hypothetical protein CVU01_01035 [Bacteroidetes bacterium HGW-Bacteroidetes-18]|nr:MAG: hypothetical protein CVU01_01035 [Bacteroidetes bacterium HGW-Bacteroidetes-18]